MVCWKVIQLSELYAEYVSGGYQAGTSVFSVFAFVGLE